MASTADFDVAFRVVGEHVTAYHVSGDPQAPVVVLLHGLGATASTYREVVSELRTHFRVIVPDLLGSGRTAKPARGYTPREIAAHVAQLLGELSVGAPHAVVGHSQGAAVAVELCARLSGIARLALLNPPPVQGMRWLRPAVALPVGGPAALVSALVPHRPLARLWLRFLYADPQKVTDEVLSAYAENAGERGYLNATAQALRALAHLELDLDGAPRTLLLWGAEDRLFRSTLAQGWRKRLPRSSLTVLPATGHCPHEERPRAVAATLREFFAS